MLGRSRDIAGQMETTRQIKTPGEQPKEERQLAKWAEHWPARRAAQSA